MAPPLAPLQNRYGSLFSRRSIDEPVLDSLEIEFGLRHDDVLYFWYFSYGSIVFHVPITPVKRQVVISFIVDLSKRQTENERGKGNGTVSVRETEKDRERKREGESKIIPFSSCNAHFRYIYLYIYIYIYI